MQISRWLNLCWYIVLPLLLTGCSDPGVRNFHFDGTVTFNGDPVVAGVIIFEPDPLQGNSGPQGSAVIKDGKYNTRKSRGQGSVGGASIVKIDCYDGKNPTEVTPYGNRIRDRYETKENLSTESATVNFDVPKD